MITFDDVAVLIAYLSAAFLLLFPSTGNVGPNTEECPAIIYLTSGLCLIMLIVIACLNWKVFNWNLKSMQWIILIVLHPVYIVWINIVCAAIYDADKGPESNSMERFIKALFFIK